MNSFLSGRILFPATSYLFNRKGILKSYHSQKTSEYWSRDKLEHFQLEKLIQLVKYSYAYVPYYRRLFDRISLNPKDIRCLQDLRSIPPLSRHDVIEHRRDLVDIRLRSAVAHADLSDRAPGEPIALGCFRKCKLVRNTSSGSTGAPTVFYEDGSQTALNWAYELRVKRWFGIEPGAKEARMARLSTNYLPTSRLLRLRQAAWNQLILPGTNLAESDYALCVERIKAFRPVTLWGYTSALAGLADYIIRSGKWLSPSTIKLAICWAAPMYDHEKTVIEKAFTCQATNLYGSREVGHVAAVCPAGNFHINQENLIVESETMEDGATEAELLVTTLDLSPMPFIRYRMGDLGLIDGSSCSCGRSLRVLTNLLGRTGEVFLARDGRMISPNFWCRVFMSDRVAGQIRRFQVVYTKDKNLRIVIVKGPGFSKQAEAYIREVVRKNFPDDTGVDFEYVPEIRPQISGKYQMVVNEARLERQD